MFTPQGCELSSLPNGFKAGWSSCPSPARSTKPCLGHPCHYGFCHCRPGAWGMACSYNTSSSSGDDRSSSGTHGSGLQAAACPGAKRRLDYEPPAFDTQASKKARSSRDRRLKDLPRLADALSVKPDRLKLWVYPCECSHTDPNCDLDLHVELSCPPSALPSHVPLRSSAHEHSLVSNLVRRQGLE